MSAPDCCARPSHPRVRRMTVTRKLADGSELCGCVCGVICADSSRGSLAVAGHGAPVYKLTAFCRQPEDILPSDRITLDGAEYTAVSVSEAGGGILTAVLRRDNSPDT